MRRSAWMLDEADFYELESRRDQIGFLLRYAILAPSSHNIQPWSFKITDDGVEVYVDYTRRLPIIDPADREILMSVGAAITNFRVAAAHFGFETTVLYQARPEESLPIAMIAVRETSAADGALRHLFSAIPTRRTNRGEFEPRPIDDTVRAALCEFVDDFSDFVRFIVPHDRPRTAELVAAADRILFANDAFRGELTEWMRDNNTELPDGICADAYGIPDGLATVGPWLLKRIDIGNAQAHRNRELVQDAAALLVVTSDDDKISLVRAGEVLERLLLLLTHLGLQYSFVNEPIEVKEVRTDLWSMIRSNRPPQVMLRAGYGRPVQKPQPRRRLEEVLGA